MNLKSKKIILLALLSFVGLRAATPSPSTFGVSAYYENWANFRGYLNLNGTVNSQGSTGKSWSRGVFPSCIPSGFSKIASNLQVLNYAFWFFNIDVSQGSPGTVTNQWNVLSTEQSDFVSWAGAVANQAADLKQYNRNLKVMVSVGGWSFVDPSSYGATTATFFTQLLSDSSKQTLFIDSLTNPKTGWFFAKTPSGNWLFDGIDVDYEYPGQLKLGNSSTVNNPNAASDYQGFINFIGALRSAINTINASGSRPGAPLYLSITLPPFMPSDLANGTSDPGTYPSGTVYAGEDYPEVDIYNTNPSTYAAWYSIVANHCDWVNLMAYDMYGAGFSNGKVMYQAPLYNTNAAPYDFTIQPDNSANGAYSVDYAVNLWITGAKSGVTPSTYIGVPSTNLILGLPSYGRGYGSTSTVFNNNPIGQSYQTDGTCWVPFQTPVQSSTNPLSTLGSRPQPYTGQTGTAAYFELKNLSGSILRNSLYTTPTASLGTDPNYAQSFFVANNSNASFDPPSNNVKQLPPNNVWVFDSTDNIADKVNYAKSYRLGGVVFYPISMDNFPMNAAASTGYDPTYTLFQQAVNTINKPSFSSFNGNTLTNTTAN